MSILKAAQSRRVYTIHYTADVLYCYAFIRDLRYNTFIKLKGFPIFQ